MASGSSCLGELGDRTTSDVILRLRTTSGRDDWLYAHSNILRSKCNYFTLRLPPPPPPGPVPEPEPEPYEEEEEEEEEEKGIEESEEQEEEGCGYESSDSRKCIELSCSDDDVDHHVTFVRLLYEREEETEETWHNVRNAIGILKVAWAFGCDEIVMKCMEYLEAVPWEESEEEEIVTSLPKLGPAVMPVLARLQPVNSDSIRAVFLSALRVATGVTHLSTAVVHVVASSCWSNQLKISAQEQVEYMIVEDDDAPLLVADEHIKSEFRSCFSKLFGAFMTDLGSLAMADNDEEYSSVEEGILVKASDILWAYRILARVSLLNEVVMAWAQSSKEIVDVLENERVRGKLWNTKFKVMEITSKVLEAVGYGNVVVPAVVRTGLVKVWLPYVRAMKPLLEMEEAEWMNEFSDGELCHNIESALTSLILSLPSEDQAHILTEWLENDQYKFPDLTEAFEVWCYRCKAAKRRLGNTVIVPIVTSPHCSASSDML